VYKMKYKSGTLLLLSVGGYSDYDVISLIRVVKDFDARKVSLAYPVKKDGYVGFDFSPFIAYLVREGFVEEVEYEEWWLGSYGSMDIPDE
jgi:hypothetical protein